jgi:hypothetical protein
MAPWCDQFAASRDIDLARAKGPGGEGAVMAGEVAQQGAAEHRHVARRRLLLRMMQARGVAEGRPLHAEAARLAVMRSANLSSLPTSASAITTATSFADCVASRGWRRAP